MKLLTLGHLVDGLERAAAAPGVIGHRREGSAVWSRGELKERARALAAGLRQAGVGSGEVVGLLAPNEPEWVVAFLAIVRAGAIAMPLSSLLVIGNAVLIRYRMNGFFPQQTDVVYQKQLQGGSLANMENR